MKKMKHNNEIIFLPEGVRSSLLQYWLLMAVEEVARVDHVEEVKLCVDGDGSLNPGIVGRGAFFYH